MMACVWFGIAPSDNPVRPSWRGFVYASAGFALIYGALDQGQRLDWLNSGLFVAMLSSGLLLLLAALARRYVQPNPLINLPLLNARNLIILGLGIVMIRFALLASLGAIPGFLGSIAGYGPIQTGCALAWVAAPQFVLVWIIAISTAFIQPRIVMASGFATIAIGCWMAAHLDSAWAGNSFELPGLVLAAGIATAFVGLVVNLLLLAAEMGGATSVVSASTYAAWMHTMRLLGGEIGTAVFSRFLTVREQFHSNLLGYHVAAGNPATDDALRGVAFLLTPSSAGPDEAAARSALILDVRIRGQALTLAYSDAFLLIGWAIAVYLLLLAFMRPASISLRSKEKTT
jgi:DHA2 family multidrug resistance protein